MEDILKELKEIKKELQDIRSTLEPGKLTETIAKEINKQHLKANKYLDTKLSIGDTELTTTRVRVGKSDVMEKTTLYPKE